MADLEQVNPEDIPVAHERDDTTVPDADPDAVAQEDEDRVAPTGDDPSDP